jgi:outer membrane protein assembly factor BamB
MRRQIFLALAFGAVLVAGLAVAFVVFSKPNHTSGKLDTALSGVTVTHVKPHKPSHEHKPKPHPVVVSDKPCWRNFGGDPQRSLARTAINLGAPTKVLWARGLHGYVEYPPSYCDGTLYVNTFRGRTFAINARNGNVLWVRGGAGPKPSTPAIAGDRLIVSSTGGTVTAYARTSGRTLWQLRIDAKVESSPVVMGRTAYFGATDGRLFAVDVVSGKIRWAYQTGGRINSSPSVWDRRICITTYAGSILCLDRRHGHLLWIRYIGRDFFRDASFYASASTDGRRLFTLSRSGLVIALRASDGATLWTHSLSTTGYSTPAVAQGRVFVGDFNGIAHAYRTATGRELWRHHVGGRILGPALVVGKLVFFSTLEQKTYALRVTDGKEVWHVGMGKYGPGIATDRHYYFTLNGIIVAYRGRYSPPEQSLKQAVGVAAAKKASAAKHGSRRSTHRHAPSTTRHALGR